MKSVIICDMEGVIQNLNKGAEEMFGYSNLELVGKKRVSIFSPGEIVLQNVFGVEAACILLLYKIDEQYWPILKTVLKHLDYLYPHELNEVEIDENISVSASFLDDRVLPEL